MYIRIVSAIIIGICLQASLACGEEYECMLNRDAIEKPAFFSSKEFESAKWDDKKKVATFRTGQGESLTITYMACENFGFDSELTVTADRKDALQLKSISRQVTWLAGKVLGSGFDRIAYISALKYVITPEFLGHFPGGVFDGSKIFVDIKGEEFSTVNLSIEVKNGKLMISIYAYRPG
jgi:hypothetical protein